MNWLLFAALLATPKLPHGQHPAPPAEAAQQQQFSADEVRERVNGYLGSIDRPITAENWRGLGPQAADVLEPIVNDANAFPSRRAKALEGLVAVSPQRAAKIVGGLARDEREAPVVRVAAMRGAGEVLSHSKALSELKPVLRSASEPGIRKTAADVLSRHKSGCAAVKEQVARESAEHREAYQRALERCGE
jgi:HEAT repeat protein